MWGYVPSVGDRVSVFSSVEVTVASYYRETSFSNVFAWKSYTVKRSVGRRQVGKGGVWWFHTISI